ncbi:MAG TPA: hypothetical protein VE195_05310, partial [Acidobacteriaceae bacterium]|nr:hypothetical protein [Acidobacteriaceae bacterium]
YWPTGYQAEEERQISLLAPVSSVGTPSRPSLHEASTSDNAPRLSNMVRPDTLWFERALLL